ncbi:YveK family protein [Glutamicibacter ardleyensis]|uniref:Polysaccharide chain length determinant N-terminal domain-containing protein n=1 Tax=Glutamicibacter ardleyensis TaxID=225894 RepID=A0ABQ2DRW3_9MICC|nr:hypothetical protein [Glutamicibacter ardleyensis]GGJ70774.1 hypothetical protein GCM10007173_32020 [Glutamicibacter ardleyensis]
MFLHDLLFSCLRRWYVLVLGLVITGMASFYVFNSIEPSYEAKASVVLIPPKVAVTVGDNPYLYLGGLDQALGVLQVKITSPEVMEPIESKYDGAEVAIAKDATTSGPIAAITVTANRADDTVALLNETLASIPLTLRTLQSELKVPANSEITTLELSKDAVPEPNNKRQIQFTAFVALGGTSISLLGTGLLDRMLIALKKRLKARKMKKELDKHLASTEQPALEDATAIPVLATPIKPEEFQEDSQTAPGLVRERARARS